jgi:cytochrome P450
MEAGDRVLCNAAFANADPSMFADGRGSDLQRQPNLHLTFGVGPHRCLGSHLARRELQVAMQELHAAIPEYRIDPQQPSFTRGGGVFGVESLHLIW